MKKQELKIGQYDKDDGRFMFRYFVHKIMPKTCDVGVFTSLDGGEYKGRRCVSYTRTLIEEQIQGCIYTNPDRVDFIVYIKKEGLFPSKVKLAKIGVDKFNLSLKESVDVIKHMDCIDPWPNVGKYNYENV